MKINWRIRFNKDNLAFIGRFILAVAVPVLTYFGMKATDLTTWNSLGDVFIRAISNPYVLMFTVVNAINILPDPTTKGLKDSDLALNKKEVK